MRYLLFVFILFIVSCSKDDDTPKYNPLYSQIKGDWYTAPRASTIRKWTFSKPEDSTHVQYMYFVGDTAKDGSPYRYYIDNSNKMFIRENNSSPWIDYKEVKIINDTLYLNGFKLHR